MKKKIQKYLFILGWSLRNTRLAFRALEMGIYTKRSLDYSSKWNKPDNKNPTKNIPVTNNPLREYFDAHTEGNGIWKWTHYFDIYHHHFSKYRGKEVHIVEIGIYSGGSLEMWRNYFGDKCKVYGVDIQKECMAYQNEGIEIFIGDQSDRNFWKDFKSKVPRIDIVIDDGGHTPEQQIVTLEEILPNISNGGVYLCEDIHGTWNNFSSYIFGLQKALNYYGKPENYSFDSSPFQRNINSIHIYPYLAVIEINEMDTDKLSLPKHGTKWELFL